MFMGVEPIFDSNNWAGVPFHFWSVVFFVFGSMAGSFLNVCIHRMPLGLSVVNPPSHCPHCKYSIPWFLNMPLITWLVLRGRCKNCAAPISVRYFLVELLTGLMFLGAWLAHGRASGGIIVLMYSLLLAGMIAATFIDFEHYIIPDEITIGAWRLACCVRYIPHCMDRQPSGPVSGRVCWARALVGELFMPSCGWGN
jgi:leader peptidase (prepilin peptidase) / N-methyltransferase